MVRYRDSQIFWMIDPDSSFDADAWFRGLKTLWDQGMPTAQHLEGAPIRHQAHLLISVYVAVGFRGDTPVN